MNYPTRSGRFILLAALTYALILLGVAILNGWTLALAVPFMVYLFATLVHRAPQIKLTAERSISTDVLPQGAPLEVMVRITNHGPDLDEVMIDDPLPRGLTLENGQVRVLTSFPHDAVVEMKYTVHGTRGSYMFNDIHVVASDHLGVLRDQALLPARSRVVYLPEVTRLRKVAIRPQRTHGHFGPIPSRQAGSGVDFYGLREYQMGDPRRWINWRASARQNQQIFVNQFEQERIADVGIILDARQQSNIVLPGGKSLFEYSIQATGSLSDALLNDGNRVALLIYGFGMERTFRGYGKIQQERILYALGQARTGHNFALESLGYLPTRFFPAGSQLVMVSPLLSADLPALSQLRSFGYDLMLVSPDPVDFEAREMGIHGSLAWELAHVERALLLRKLQRLGIRVLDWPVDRPFEPLVRTTLSRVSPGRHLGLKGSL
jgi:uncharacterized protein (DUF58 family)